MAYERMISSILNNSIWDVDAWLQSSGIQERDLG